MPETDERRTYVKMLTTELIGPYYGQPEDPYLPDRTFTPDRVDTDIFTSCGHGVGVFESRHDAITWMWSEGMFGSTDVLVTLRPRTADVPVIEPIRRGDVVRKIRLGAVDVIDVVGICAVVVEEQSTDDVRDWVDSRLWEVNETLRQHRSDVRYEISGDPVRVRNTFAAFAGVTYDDIIYMWPVARRL